ncbi:MAG: hypothetical protein F6K14_08610 [Symploca sp. SIO2C1]|nr:hypothetical protein [Symploca sp. SIO2C1]
MEQIPNIQELSIVLTVPNHNPTLLTPDFLAGSGIIPTDWELSRPPVLSARASQVAFTSGTNIVAQPGTITFSETLNHKDSDEVQVAAIAKKYAKTLPNLDYQAIGINPKRFITFENEPDGGRNYITKTLFAPGSWQDVGTEPLQASINLVYTLEHRQLRLTIGEAKLKLPDKDSVSAILFAGNFHYTVTGETAEERIKHLQEQLDNWQSDLEAFQEIIDTKFLSQPKSETILSIRDAV